MVVDKKVKGNFIEVFSFFEYIGCLKFRVRSGSCEVFGRLINPSEDWTRLVQDPKRGIIYPIHKHGKAKLTIELAEEIPSKVNANELIKSAQLNLKNIRELEKRDNELNRFLKDQSWEKISH